MPLALMESAHSRLIRSSASTALTPGRFKGVQVLLPSFELYPRNSEVVIVFRTHKLG